MSLSYILVNIMNIVIILEYVYLNNQLGSFPSWKCL